MKVAKIVVVTLLTRVVVDEDLPDEDVVEIARGNLERNLRSDLHENVDAIFDDKECPFGVMDEDYLGG